MVNKFVDKRYWELATWSMVLLINDSMWDEFKHNWQLICVVFLQIYYGKDHCDREIQDALLNKISKVKSDPNNIDAIKSTETEQDKDASKSSYTDSYEFDDDKGEDDRDDDKIERSFSRVTNRKVRKLQR